MHLYFTLKKPSVATEKSDSIKKKHHNVVAFLVAKKTELAIVEY